MNSGADGGQEDQMRPAKAQKGQDDAENSRPINNAKSRAYVNMTLALISKHFKHLPKRMKNE